MADLNNDGWVRGVASSLVSLLGRSLILFYLHVLG